MRMKIKEKCVMSQVEKSIFDHLTAWREAHANVDVDLSRQPIETDVAEVCKCLRRRQKRDCGKGVQEVLYILFMPRQEVDCEMFMMRYAILNKLQDCVMNELNRRKERV